MSWNEWDNPETKSRWTAAMDAIESAAARLAASRGTGATITRGRHDTPEVTMKWLDGEANRNLQFVIATPEWPLEVKFLGHVWRDRDGERAFQAIDFGSVRYDDAADLTGRFPSDLASAFDQSSRLRLSRAAAGD